MLLDTLGLSRAQFKHSHFPLGSSNSSDENSDQWGTQKRK